MVSVRSFFLVIPISPTSLLFSPPLFLFNFLFSVSTLIHVTSLLSFAPLLSFPSQLFTFSLYHSTSNHKSLLLTINLSPPLAPHSVKELRSAGFSPDFIVCRAKKIIETGSKNKISLFCNVDQENVLSIPDVSNIYHVPLLLLQQNFHNLLAVKLNLKAIQDEKHAALPKEQQQSELKEKANEQEIKIDKSLVKSWEEMVSRIDCATDDVSIALIGKYTNQQDSYLSVISALKHSCIATDQKLKLVMIESSDLEEEAKGRDPAAYDAAWTALKKADGVLVPGTANNPTCYTRNITSISSFTFPFSVTAPAPSLRFLLRSSTHLDLYLISNP